MPDKFVTTIITPFGERKVRASAVTDGLMTAIKAATKNLVLITTSNTFEEVTAILDAGQLPVFVDYTLADSPYFYGFVYNNDDLEYIFANLSGSTYRERKLVDGIGWGAITTINLEDKANKVSSWSATPNNTRYPTEKLVHSYLPYFISTDTANFDPQVTRLQVTEGVAPSKYETLDVLAKDKNNDPATRTIFNPACFSAAWHASTSYTADEDIVWVDGLAYLCNTTHTSGATFDATEQANWTSYNWLDKIWSTIGDVETLLAAL